MLFYQIQLFSCLIATSVADAAVVNTSDIKKLLANGLRTFSLKGNPVFTNGFKSLPRNPPNCPILCNWIFILSEQLFAKALRNFKTCVLVSNNLCGKYSHY